MSESVGSATVGRPGGGGAPPAPREFVDVWSRTEPKYRIRAMVLLFVDLVLFCGLCVFGFWLREARLFDFSWDSYVSPARFWADHSPNLNDYILEPISVERTPVHALVLGLLVAALVGIPIVIAILYRFVFALPFVAAVVIFAHMPWLAFTLLGSCILASVRPFRMRFRFGSALLGMLLVLAYLYLATRGGSDQFSAASPIERTLLAAPWVLAILGACAMIALVLIIARIVNYRPGAVAPVVALMFALPLVLFHLRVGVDELAYRVLELQYGPANRRFAVDQSPQETQRRIRALFHEWTGRGEEFSGQALDSLWAGDVDYLKRLVREAWQASFSAERFTAYEACKRFISDHPRSRYALSAHYLQARVLDTRLDERKLAGAAPRIEYYTDFPHPQSETAWSTLLGAVERTPLAVPAGLRLAQLRARRGEIDAALDALEIARRCDARLESAALATRPSAADLLAAEAPEASLLLERRADRIAIRRLAALLRENRDDRRGGDLPLQQYLSLDEHRIGFAEALLALAERFPESKIRDNVLVRWAIVQADAARREAALVALCGALTPGDDALPEALFQLASIELQSIGPDAAARRTRGAARLRDVVARFDQSVWAVEAGERLRLLEPATVDSRGRP